MGTRRESVELSLRDDLTPGLLKVAAAAELADNKLKHVGSGFGPNMRSGTRDIESQSRALTDYEAKARRAERSSSLLADTAITLGPAFGGVAALAVPAMAGVSAQLGLGVAAAGTAVLAFHGVGKALEALRAYDLDPTAANLEKLNQTMANLGPAGQAFVRELDSLEPRLRKLQATAQAGLLPGVTEGMEHLLTIFPQVRRIIAEIADTSGDLAAEAGKNLAGPGYREFFDYLERDARPILTDLGRTIGDITGGFAHLLVDFAPEEREFAEFMLRVGRSFDDWADGLDSTDGFTDFIGYIQRTGPQVAETVVAVSKAIASVAAAGAPLSGPTLRALTELADIVDRIASSPVGTPLVSLAAGLALINRALATRDLAKGSIIGQMIAGRSQGIERTRTSLSGLTRDLRLYSRSMFDPTRALAPASEIEAQAAATGRLGSRLGSLAKGTAVVGGLALVTSGLADKMHLTSTAIGATAGSLAGPFGAAAGAAIGALLDLKSSGDAFADALDRIDTSLRRGDLATAGENLKQVTDHVEDLKKLSSVGDAVSGSLSLIGSSIHDVAHGDLSSIGDLLTGGGSKLGRNQLKEMTDQAARAREQFTQVVDVYRDIAAEVGRPLPHDASISQIAAVADAAAPALDRLGLSVGELQAQRWTDALTGAHTYEKSLTRIGDALSYADSNAGRIDDLATAVAGLDDPLKTTAQSAAALSTALDGVFSPKLGRAAAADALIKSLQTLRTQIKGAAGLGTGKLTDSAAQLANRGAIQDAVQALNAKVKADAAAGASSAKLSRDLQQGRRAILDQAEAAGLSRSTVAAYLRTLGLTPKLVSTLVKLNGAPAARGAIAGVLAGLDQLDNTTANPKIHISANTGVIAAVAAGLNQLNTTTATPRVRPTKRATGGRVFGPGGPTDDRVPILASNGEGVIKAATMDYYDRKFGAAWFDDLNAGRFATGGRVRRRPPRAAFTSGLSPAAIVAAGGGYSLDDITALGAASDLADQQQQIADLISQLNATHTVGKGKHKHKELVLQGIARDATQKQLAALQAQLAYFQANGKTYDEAKQAADDATQAINDAAQALSDTRYQSAQQTAGYVDIFGRGTSAASAQRSVEKALQDIAAYGSAFASLQAAGAGAGILNQIKARGDSGDFVGATKLANSLLANPTILGTINTDLNVVSQIATGLANLTNPAGGFTGRR